MFPMMLRMPLLLSVSWQLHFAVHSRPASLWAVHGYNPILDLTRALPGNRGSRERSKVFIWSGKKTYKVLFFFFLKVFFFLMAHCLHEPGVTWAAWSSFFFFFFFAAGFALHTKAKPSWIPFWLCILLYPSHCSWHSKKKIKINQHYSFSL